MTKSYFITGTDTDVGKTFVTELLLKQLNLHQPTIGYKPIAAGAEMTEDGLRNSDALILQQSSVSGIDYSTINPICYQEAIAPHIAAALHNESLSIEALSQWWHKVQHLSPVALIEGAGGWRLPINDHEFLSDFVKAHQLEVIVVVGMKLGCLNHTLLTLETIRQDGLVIKGWVANQLDLPMSNYDENLAYLKQSITEPLLGEVKAHQTFSPDQPLFELDGLLD
ncbi:dethiobiotin synthase [Psychrobium sp. 1_MG-2023]|uniref:dethiobiotin synthase n=1 Tax=Psychrobium sp. 1_MG-2023 TaxID=3062624 RepID=UPI0026C7F61F|nr:dethiobiotin synthase [Psychrobium sp. 1_MG-2023]MDP2562491.1 dethiobiotin synthase [Psychrobium sp. 1_MG-2023]